MGFRLILRRLLTSPGFTIVTVLTLAVGLGANSAIFSVINGIMLKPLPYPEADRLIEVNHVAPGMQGLSPHSAPFLYFTYREQSRTFEDVGIWRTNAVSVTGLGEPERVDVLDVTDGTLALLRVQPAAGRIFSRQDDLPDSPPTVMLSYGYWQSKFGGDAGAIGRSLTMDGRSQLIIGVLPKDFWFFDLKPSLVEPLRWDRNKVYLGRFGSRAIARLKPGITMEQAQSDAARLIPVALRSFPPFPGSSRSRMEKIGLAPAFRPLKDQVTGDIGNVLWTLMGTIGMVLLIACANVANLLLVRGEGRQQELAIRAALGAGWARIARELLLESAALGLLGGALGLALAYGGLRLLVAAAPADLPRLSSIGVDGSVILFTLAISTVAVAVFGAIPALRYATPAPATALSTGERTLGHSKERHRARNLLVVVQVALALVLLVSSGLMIRTFYALQHVRPGFSHPESLQTLSLSTPSGIKDEDQALHMQQEIVERIAAVPGVESAAIISEPPLGDGGRFDAIYASDREDSGLTPPLRFFKYVSPGWFHTAGNPLVAGRDFTWADLYEGKRVAIVAENLARELWGSAPNAIGRRIRLSAVDPWREIVGVAGDDHAEGLNQPPSQSVYWPLHTKGVPDPGDLFAPSLSYAIRSPRAGTSAFSSDLQRAIWSVNAGLPLADVETMASMVRHSMARTSFTLVMLGIAGGMALFLGIIGLYGVISYSVSQRTREIGIRVALGATLRQVIVMFVGHGLRLAAVGVACGLAAAAALSRLLKGLLFEVRPIDPATYLAVSLGLVAAAALASYLPARRGARVNPVEALRSE